MKNKPPIVIKLTLMAKTESAGLPPELEAVLKKVSRTLYLSIKALPSEVRAPMAAGYLLCRAADSITDTRIVHPSLRLEFIRTFPLVLNAGKERENFLEALAAGLSPAVTDSSEKELLRSLSLCLSAYDGLSAPEKSLIQEVVKDECEGMSMDLSFFPPEDSGQLRAFETAERLEKYCSLIGGSPGVFWTGLYSMNIPHGGAVPDKNDGRMIGEALQVTNILKDISSDLRIGRCYLPSNELAAAGLTPEKLLNPDSIASLEPVISLWIRRAVSRLDRSENYISSIPGTRLRLRAAVIWPVYWAMDTLAEIKKARHLLDHTRKTKISRALIYSTIFRTPATLLSDSAFVKGYRLRRETLLSGPV